MRNIIDLNMKYGTNNLIILLKIQNIILYIFFKIIMKNLIVPIQKSSNKHDWF